MDSAQTFTAKYGGICNRCGLRISRGQRISWDRAAPHLRAHVICPERVPAPVSLDHRRTWRRHRPWDWERNRQS